VWNRLHYACVRVCGSAEWVCAYSINARINKPDCPGSWILSRIWAPGADAASKWKVPGSQKKNGNKPK